MSGDKKPLLSDKMLEIFEFAGQIAASEKANEDKTRDILLRLIEMMDAFDRVAPEEQADVLALMMVKARN